MSTYHPDRWMLVKLTSNESTHYRVFASWAGGFAGSDEWKLNSGITKVSMIDDCYHFDGESGSTYICHKNCYGAFSYQWGVIKKLKEQANPEQLVIEILDEKVDPLLLEYVK